MGMVLLAIAAYCTSLSSLKARISAWLAIVFLAYFLYRACRLVVVGDTAMIIDKRGIEDRRFHVGIFTWDQISRLEIRQVESVKILCIHLVDETRFVSSRIGVSNALQMINHALGLPTFSIMFKGLDCDIEDAIDAISYFAPRLAPPNPTK